MESRSILGQEVWTSVLNHAVISDVLENRIPSVTDGYDDRSGLGGYFPEVVSKGEDGPIVIDSTEIGILIVVENTARDERGANGDIAAGPVSRVEVLPVCERRVELLFLVGTYRECRVKCRAVYPKRGPVEIRGNNGGYGDSRCI